METFLYLRYTTAGTLQCIYLYDGEYEWLDFVELGIIISQLDEANVIYAEVDYDDEYRRSCITPPAYFQHVYSNQPERAAEYLNILVDEIKPLQVFSNESLMAIGADILHKNLQYQLAEVREGRVELTDQTIGNLSRIQGILNRARNA